MACEEAESLRGEGGAEARQKHNIGGEMKNERAVRGAAVQRDLQRAFCSGEVEVSVSAENARGKQERHARDEQRER